MKQSTSERTRALVTAAVLIALAVGFQNLRLLIGTTPVSTYLIGSLVNLCLIVAVAAAGLLPGLAVALLAPLVALLQGFAAAPMVPFIIAGNALLVAVYALASKRGAGASASADSAKRGADTSASTADGGKRALIAWYAGGTVAAVLKYLVIALGMALMLSGKKGVALNGAILGTAFAQQLQQPITALIAMIVAPLVLRGLRRAGVAR